jgi:hypothetical protein
VDAYVRGSTVLRPDLLAGELQRHWTVFADAALEAGASAVFAFPLQIGTISPGVLDLYSSSSVELDADEVADAVAFADTATLPLLDVQISETGVPFDTGASGTDQTGPNTSGTDRPKPAPFDDLGGYRGPAQSGPHRKRPPGREAAGEDRDHRTCTHGAALTGLGALRG